MSKITKPITSIIINTITFEVIGTGGGCTALEYVHENGYILITREDDPSVPAMKEKVCVGFYREDILVGAISGITLKQLVDKKITITF